MFVLEHGKGKKVYGLLGKEVSINKIPSEISPIET
jgi:hypothetical protein